MGEDANLPIRVEGGESKQGSPMDPTESSHKTASLAATTRSLTIVHNLTACPRILRTLLFPLYPATHHLDIGGREDGPFRAERLEEKASDAG